MLDSPLLRTCQGYLDGRWLGAHDGRTLPVLNPATGQTLAEVPNMGAAETTQAIEAADRAWGKSTIEQRRTWMTGIADALIRHRDELARLITLEQGKPLAESKAEVDYGAGFFTQFVGHLEALKPRVLAEKARGCTWMVHRCAAGVAGLITPWNFPLALLAKKMSAALAAGCSVVAKPADLTPLTAIAFWHLLDQLDLPAGLVNLVVGEPAPIGQVMCAHPAVRVVSFTGSTRVGKLLAGQCAPHVKRLSLELGGNAPYIVFDDADVSAAADALIPNKFRCAGQTCVCTNRVYVHESVARDFGQAIVARVSRLRVGDGMEEGVEIGPLINRAGFDKVMRHVDDALAKGATKLFGDTPTPPANAWGCYFPPTVLTGIVPTMQLVQEETFGPVVAIATFTKEDEVIRAANSTPYGLAAYFFTHDEARAQRVAAQLRFGHVGWNTGTGPAPHAPFGGMKQSGHGREGGVEGLDEFTETQTIAHAL